MTAKTRVEKIKPVVFVDESKCCNYHRCISVCPVKYCNDGSSGTVKINHELCIGCGACIEACIHGARYGIDDTDEFFSDLKAGKKII
ncbi:MAG: 4Fe-4S binding protein, partial [Treponema sp.]|nr:4Fe-4S binding protein [Treponema sp.]